MTREGKNRVATFFSVLGLCRPRCCADVNCVSKNNFPGKRRNRSAWMLPDPGVQQWTVPGNTSPHLGHCIGLISLKGVEGIEQWARM